jgi:hypothetical protein
MVAQVDALIHDNASRRSKILEHLSTGDDRSVMRLNDTTTVAIVDSDGANVVAFAAVLRYSTNQAYCLLAEVHDSVRHPLSVHIEPMDEHRLKLTKTSEKAKDRRLMPIYVQTHVRPAGRLTLEHLIDAVVERALGVENLELKKNVTVDLYASDATAIWRDRAGFCVTDRHQYAELTIDRQLAINRLTTTDESCTIRSIGGDIAKLVEYDQTVTQMQRHDFIEYLAGLPNICSAIGYDEDERIIGYALGIHGHVMCCYAESEHIANALLVNVIQQFSGVGPITLNVRKGTALDEMLASVATETRRIYRYHTRAVPAQTKWDKVHVLNIGLHLV